MTFPLPLLNCSFSTLGIFPQRASSLILHGTQFIEWTSDFYANSALPLFYWLFPLGILLWHCCNSLQIGLLIIQPLLYTLLCYKPDYQESLQWPPIRVRTQIFRKSSKLTLSLMLFFMNFFLAKLISTSCPYFLPHTHFKIYYKLILSDFTNILSVIYYFYFLHTLLFSLNFQPQKI